MQTVQPLRTKAEIEKVKAAHKASSYATGHVYPGH